MMYYTLELDDASQDPCTINTSFGLYQYCRMAMGLKISLDEAQAMMEKVLSGIDEVEIYIDDIAMIDPAK